jgi:hypothetical protein
MRDTQQTAAWRKTSNTIAGRSRCKWRPSIMSCSRPAGPLVKLRVWYLNRQERTTRNSQARCPLEAGRFGPAHPRPEWFFGDVVSVHARDHPARARQDAAELYDAGLNQIEDVVLPDVAADRTHVHPLYTIRHPRPGGVQTAINYHVALSFVAAHRRLGHPPRTISQCLSRPEQNLVAADVRRNQPEQQRPMIDLV